MIDPLFALTALFVFLVITALFLWPEKGIIGQLKSAKQKTERVLLEDMLKQMYDLEYRNIESTLKSIAGAMELDQEKTAFMLEKLFKMGLSVFHESHFKLTKEGRTYALRIIRLHRLWEKYFADETGLPETDWHKEAELREHTTSVNQANALASSMGYPMFDPHGDPIPTPSGEIPPAKGIPLSDLYEGELARIIHIEDEPEALYAQLVAEDLYPGMQIHLREKSSARLHFIADGEEKVLAPMVAANITVMRIPREQEEQPYESLLELKIGQSGEVAGISKACRGQQRRRLMDLGIVPGTVISADLESTSGNPKAYNICGASIALRNEQARTIKIKKLEPKS
jgi:DtxR family transcriptional regulator, Mn-dependent transcriptional regulator